MTSPKNTSSQSYSLSELDQIILGPVEAQFLKLGLPTKPTKFPNEPLWRWIAHHRRSRKLERKAMAEILNRVLTNKQPKFLLSQKLMAELIRAGRGINGEDHKRIMNKLLAIMKAGEAFLREISPPQRGIHGHSNRAGVYTLSNSKIISMIPWWNSHKPSEASTGIPSNVNENVIVDEF